MIEYSEKDGAVTFAVRVVPRASRTEIAGEIEGAVKVKVAAPPVDGAANVELMKLFAKTLGVAKSDVQIVSGLASRTKQLRILGVTVERLRQTLG